MSLRKMLEGLAKSHQKAGVAFLFCCAVLTEEFAALSEAQQVVMTCVVCAFLLSQGVANFGKGAKMAAEASKQVGDA